MQNLIATAVTVGLSLYASPIVALASTGASVVMTAKEKAYQFNLLIAEIEQAKELLRKTKALIDSSLERELAICNLFTLIDSLNSFQVFFRNNFMGKTNHGMMAAWPAWYRSELRHGIAHLISSLLMFQQEIDSYSSIGTTSTNVFWSGGPVSFSISSTTMLEYESISC
jgi:hypothetical protein